jgi:hypothetical protein
MPTERYLYRVQYTLPDGSLTYEPVCVRAESETAARTEVTEATARYAAAARASREFDLVVVTPDAA